MCLPAISDDSTRWAIFRGFNGADWQAIRPLLFDVMPGDMVRGWELADLARRGGVTYLKGFVSRLDRLLTVHDQKAGSKVWLLVRDGNRGVGLAVDGFYFAGNEKMPEPIEDRRFRRWEESRESRRRLVWSPRYAHRDEMNALLTSGMTTPQSEVVTSPTLNGVTHGSGIIAHSNGSVVPTILPGSADTRIDLTEPAKNGMAHPESNGLAATGSLSTSSNYEPKGATTSETRGISDDGLPLTRAPIGEGAGVDLKPGPGLPESRRNRLGYAPAAPAVDSKPDGVGQADQALLDRYGTLNVHDVLSVIEAKRRAQWAEAQAVKKKDEVSTALADIALEDVLESASIPDEVAGMPQADPLETQALDPILEELAQAREGRGELKIAPDIPFAEALALMKAQSARRMRQITTGETDFEPPRELAGYAHYVNLLMPMLQHNKTSDPAKDRLTKEDVKVTAYVLAAQARRRSS